MTYPVTLDTPRLKLRQWQESDYPAFARLNADAEVMEFFPNPLTWTENDALAASLQASIKKNGWGFWALELKSTGDFIGFTGVQSNQIMPFSPCVEIGWRLAREHWRQGYATEAAKRSLTYAFQVLKLPEVVSFAADENLPSKGVMKKIGLHNAGKNFQHPALPINHKLREHVLFNITREQWHSQQ